MHIYDIRFRQMYVANTAPRQYLKSCQNPYLKIIMEQCAMESILFI